MKLPTDEQLKELAGLTGRQYKTALEIGHLVIAHYPKTNPTSKKRSKALLYTQSIRLEVDLVLESRGMSQSDRLRLFDALTGESDENLFTPPPPTARRLELSDADFEDLARCSRQLLDDAVAIWQLGMKTFPIKSREYREICSAGKVIQNFHDQVRRDAVDHKGWIKKAWDGTVFSKTFYEFS